MRLKDKIAVLVGAGQGPGEGMGNGRATALRFAQEGGRVLCVDRDLASAEETAARSREAGGEAAAFEADVTREATLAAAVAEAVRRWGRLDVLHYNVGVSIAGGDAPPTEITEEAFDRVTAVNLRGFVMAVKHALPVMRPQRSGVILSISSPRGGGERLPQRRLQGDQGGDDRLHRAGCVPERQARHPLQHHPARADGHADGG